MFVFAVGVVGAGVMGAQIAQAVAAAGELPVRLHDVDPAAVDSALAEAREITERRAARAVEEGRLDEAQAAARVERTVALIDGTTSLADFGHVDLVIEAVPEVLATKQDVFAQLDACTPGHAVLATNTSSLPVTAIADAVSPDRRERVLGMHFFWPASVMRLVEVVVAEETSPEAVQLAMGFAQRIRKSPIRCLESPGFVVNRILGAMNSEVWAAQEEGGVPIEDVDAAVRESALVPMGPFEVADMVGLDTVVRVAGGLRDAYGDSFRVHSGMEERVSRGELGAKTGKGFYEH